MSPPEDVAEGKINDDEFITHYGNAPTRRRRLNILLTTALSFIVILLLFLFNYSGSNGISSTTRLLKISPLTVETTFKRIEELEDFSPAADGVWEDLFTANGGFIVRKIDGKQHRIGISMFHQLHCLKMLRSLMQSLANNTENTVDNLSKHTHEAHCFSYLVQSILCAADDTIELPMTLEDGTVTNAINGYVMHQCRANDGLYKLSAETGVLDDPQASHGTHHSSS